MTQIELVTYIDARIEKCFDLSRSIDLHVESMSHTGERVIAGRTNGLIEPGETVTWSARHLGVRQTLTSKIIEFNYPHSFTDEMLTGPFKSMRHEHLFYALGDQTVMKDIFLFEAPFGGLGRLFNFVFLGRYMQKLLQKRNQVIKLAAASVALLFFFVVFMNN